MKTKREPWKRVNLTASLLVRNFGRPNPSVLLGLKNGGVLDDMVMPTGGHIEEDDMGAFTASRRETFEEANLNPSMGSKVAELSVRIDETRTRYLVKVYLFTTWTGRLKNKTPEFKWLKFVKFSEFPWEKMPGERGWYTDVLTKHRRRKVHIHCGKDRKNVLSVRVRPLR